MNTCKTCKHWGQHWPTDPGRCVCNCGALYASGTGGDGIHDNNGTSNPIYTGEAFGCVHHEPKTGSKRPVGKGGTKRSGTDRSGGAQGLSTRGGSSGD